MSSEHNEPKIGAGHASAMFRLGLAELRAALTFSDSNIVQPSFYGIYGTKTPGEVQDERKSSSKNASDEPPSTLSAYVEKAGHEPETGQEQREPDRE
jgi:hypothetical protein